MYVCLFLFILNLYMIEYNKNIVRILNIYVPSQNPTALSNLNATLGQNAINVFEFNKHFINLSKMYINDIILNIEVQVYKDKKIDINVKGPSTIFLLYEEIFNKNNNLKEIDFVNDSFILNLSDLYKVVIFIKKFSKTDQNIISILKSILGTIKSSKIIVLNDLI